MRAITDDKHMSGGLRYYNEIYDGYINVLQRQTIQEQSKKWLKWKKVRSMS